MTHRDGSGCSLGTTYPPPKENGGSWGSVSRWRRIVFIAYERGTQVKVRLSAILSFLCRAPLDSQFPPLRGEDFDTLLFLALYLLCGSRGEDVYRFSTVYRTSLGGSGELNSCSVAWPASKRRPEFSIPSLVATSADSFASLLVGKVGKLRRRGFPLLAARIVMVFWRFALQVCAYWREEQRPE